MFQQTILRNRNGKTSETLATAGIVIEDNYQQSCMKKITIRMNT